MWLSGTGGLALKGSDPRACPPAAPEEYPEESGPALEHDPKGIQKRLDGKSTFQRPQRTAAGGLGLLPNIIFYFGQAIDRRRNLRKKTDKQSGV